MHSWRYSLSLAILPVFAFFASAIHSIYNLDWNIMIYWDSEIDRWRPIKNSNWAMCEAVVFRAIAPTVIACFIGAASVFAVPRILLKRGAASQQGTNASPE